MNEAPSYRLWSGKEGVYEYDVAVQAVHKAAIRRLFEQNWQGASQSVSLQAQLIPEPDGPRGPWAIAVRCPTGTLGYLDDVDAPIWATPVRRIIASGYVPTVDAQVWAHETEWERIELSATVRLSLGRVEQAVPLNHPPVTRYTMLPKSAIVQVTKEDLHEALLRFVPQGGYGVLFVTLHEAGVTGKPHVEVRIDDVRIGQLTPQMGQRFLPLIRRLQENGLTTACWGDITGSAVAAEVRINGIKANEASNELLKDMRGVQVPRLVAHRADPREYDMSGAGELLTPIAPLPLRVAPEPPDGSLVRFAKFSGRYNYVAVRRGDHWETTSTTDRGSMDELMSWQDLAERIRTFELVYEWSPVDPRGDPRVREPFAVVRFTINGLYLAAVNIDQARSEEGDWYTTISDDAERKLPFGDCATWRQIQHFGRHIEVAMRWAPYRSDGSPLITRSEAHP